MHFSGTIPSWVTPSDQLSVTAVRHLLSPADGNGRYYLYLLPDYRQTVLAPCVGSPKMAKTVATRTIRRWWWRRLWHRFWLIRCRGLSNSWIFGGSSLATRASNYKKGCIGWEAAELGNFEINQKMDFNFFLYSYVNI